MAISLVAGSTGTNNSVGTGTTINKPTGTAQSDLMVMLMVSDSATAAPTAPTGWTALVSRNENSLQYCATAYKVAGASEPTSYTWTAGSGGNWHISAMVTLRGQDGTTPIGAKIASGTGAGGTSVTIASQACNAGDELVTFVVSDNNHAISTWPTGVSLYSQASDSNDDLQTGTKALSAGGTGSLTYTWGTSDVYTAIAIVVQAPASSGTAWSQSLSDTQSGLDATVKNPSKMLKDAHSATDQWLNTLSKLLTDMHSAQDVLSKTPAKLLADYMSATDTRLGAWNKTLSEATSAQDGLNKLVNKLLVDSTSGLDSRVFNVTKKLADFVSLVDTLSTVQGHFLTKTLTDIHSGRDTVSATKLAAGTAWVKNLTDAHSALDVLKKLPSKVLAENLSAIDAFARVWTAQLAIADLFSETDFVAKNTVKPLKDSSSATDFMQRFAGQLLLLADSHSATDQMSKLALKALAEAVSATDTLTRSYAKLVLDQMSATDRMSAGRALYLTLQDWLSETDAIQTLHSFPTGVFRLGLVLGTITNLLGVQVSLATPLVSLETSVFMSIMITPSIY